MEIGVFQADVLSKLALSAVRSSVVHNLEELVSLYYVYELSSEQRHYRHVDRYIALFS